MKILYTDIDGVLSLSSEMYPKSTKWGSIHRFNAKAVKVFNNILEKTGAEIVVSSDWRIHFTLQQLQEIFVEWAGIIKPPIDVTPYIPGATMQTIDEFRAKEILQHVEKHKPTAWVAIDDLELQKGMLPWVAEEHFIHLPHMSEGIKQSSKADKVINLLNKNDIV